MVKIKKFIDCYIPITTCNFQCEYCYIAQQGLFRNERVLLKHSLDKIKSALSVERLGGLALINLCAGGETLLFEDIVHLVKCLVEIALAELDFYFF